MCFKEIIFKFKELIAKNIKNLYKVGNVICVDETKDEVFYFFNLKNCKITLGFRYLVWEILLIRNSALTESFLTLH